MDKAIKLDNNDFRSSSKQEIAIERGKRIRMARVLSGLSRQEFQDTLGVSTSTLNAWENGRICLTEKGAIRISKALSTINISCSYTWLLDEIGEAPRALDSKKLNIQSEEYSECNDILDEITFFLSRNDNSICVRLNDDKMNPFYKKNDFIGGIIVNSAEYYDLIGENVIFSYNDYQYVRKLVNIIDGKFLFEYTNKKYSCVINDNIMSVDRSNIRSIAKIVLVRTEN